MKRTDTHEHLDEHDAPLDDVAESLRDLRRINRYLGGTRIYRTLLRRMFPDRSRRLRVIDLGTGSADLPAAIDQRELLAIGVDFKIAHLALADRRIRRVAANALALPIRNDAVDVVTSNHFFHHFTPDENVALLSEALRVARVGVVVNDTRRSVWPYLFVKLVGFLRLVGRITRFDAPASVLRGYTIPEARAIVERTPARRWDVVRMFPFRFGLLLWK